MLAQEIHAPEFRRTVCPCWILRKKGNIGLDLCVLVDCKKEGKFRLAVCVQTCCVCSCWIVRKRGNIRVAVYVMVGSKK